MATATTAVVHRACGENCWVLVSTAGYQHSGQEGKYSVTDQKEKLKAGYRAGNSHICGKAGEEGQDDRH